MSDTTPTSATLGTTTITALPVTPPAPDTELEGLGDKGKLTLIKIRDERDALKAERDSAATELKTLRDAEAKREQDAKAAADAKAIQDGEFEKLANDRADALKTATDERDALKDRTAKYEALITPIVTERLESLKTASADVAKGFPADADVLTQLAWLDDPRTKALIATGSAKADNLRKWPGTPQPNGDMARANDEEARRSQGRMYRDF